MIKCNTCNILDWILESEKKTLVENWWNLNEVYCLVNNIANFLVWVNVPWLYKMLTLVEAG